MSNNQGYYGEGQQDNNPYHQASSNPWASEQGHLPEDQQQRIPQYHQQQQQSYEPYQPESQSQSNPWGDSQGHTHQQPSGPPPGHEYQQQQHQSQHQNFIPQPPRRTGTDTIVPESERGEQREAMEQFELTKSVPESQVDRDVAILQREFPETDGALIAALYGDSKDMGATREMLKELSGS